MRPTLPYSQAAENNKVPIAEVLTREFAQISHVLEIGSCTGQHAVHLGRAMPHLQWQASDIASRLDGLRARIETEALANVLPPIILDVTDDPWPIDETDAIFSANVIHIISKPKIEAMFRGTGRHLRENGLFCLYGPFKYEGNFTSESNARFELWLKNNDPEAGVRDFEWIDGLARAQGLTLQRDYKMPANNQLIIWERV